MKIGDVQQVMYLFYKISHISVSFVYLDSYL